MELRHLRCFLAVSEELHFARAAEKLHIEQSPLSRAIKELEEDLGVQLFVRTSRSTRLTRAGKLFQEHVLRIFAALEQARESMKSAANGFHGQLRIALSDGITPSRLPRDIEELQVDEHALVAAGQLVQHLEVLARRQQFHADLVERHAVAEAVDPLQRLRAIRHVQREDQALVIAQRQRRAAHGA